MKSSKNLSDHELERLKIIKSDENINSYKLAERCDYSIVLGSKIGIELAAMG